MLDNLNTLYVDIKPFRGGDTASSRFNLNTLYVDIKLSVITFPHFLNVI